MYKRQPLYSDVCCGDGIFVEDNIEEYISLPESLLSSRKDYFCQYADGDSTVSYTHLPFCKADD